MLKKIAKKYINKKVLLRERKRHTARRVASTPYVVLTGYPPTRVPPWPGYPPGRVPPHQGTPPARVPPWPGYPQGYPPSQGTPLPGYPPGQGTPPARPGRVPPPPPGCPMAFWEMLQSIMGYGSPPWIDRLMDRRVSKHYLPVVLRTRAVNICFNFSVDDTNC